MLAFRDMLSGGSSRLWQQLLLLVGVVAISLGVLAMHQLAVNHSFAAPATGHSHIHPHEVAGAMVHNSLADVLPVEHSHSRLTVGSGPANLLARLRRWP